MGKQILRNKKNLKVAIIVNDMGAINLDAEEVKKHRLVQEKSEMVELQNGCICCTLRGDLLRTVKELAEENKYDYLVIESTGIAEPLPVAQTFVMDVNTGEHQHPPGQEHQPQQKSAKGRKQVASEFQPLSKYSRMDTLVTVLDAFNFYRILSKVESFNDRAEFLGPEELQKEEAQSKEQNQSVVQLLIDQIEFANVLLLNKIDLLPTDTRESTIKEIKNIVAKLNPKAQVIIPDLPYFEEFDVELVMNTGIFNMQEAMTSAGWLAELDKPMHNPETEEYGIGSLVFRENNRPFHPKRLNKILENFGKIELAWTGEETENKSSDLFAGVIRCKGNLWLANADACPVEIHSAGRQLQLVVNPSRVWVKKLIDQYPNGDRNKKDSEPRDVAMWESKGIKQLVELNKEHGYWSEMFGDRRSELVLIGIHLDKKRLEEELLKACMTDAEINSKQAWLDLWNPESYEEFGKCGLGGSPLWSLEDVMNYFIAQRRAFFENEREEERKKRREIMKEKRRREKEEKGGNVDEGLENDSDDEALEIVEEAKK